MNTNETWEEFHGYEEIMDQQEIDLPHEYFEKKQHGALKAAIEKIRNSNPV